MQVDASQIGAIETRMHLLVSGLSCPKKISFPSPLARSFKHMPFLMTLPVLAV